MKKFFFRLETLLKVRRVRESRMQRELAYVQQKLAKLEEKERTLEHQVDSLLNEIRLRREKGDSESYSSLLDHLNASLVEAKEARLVQSKQVDEVGERLKQLVIERKVIEKIKEKNYAQWRVQLEQSQDEVAISTPPK